MILSVDSIRSCFYVIKIILRLEWFPSKVVLHVWFILISPLSCKHSILTIFRFILCICTQEITTQSGKQSLADKINGSVTCYLIKPDKCLINRKNHMARLQLLPFLSIDTSQPAHYLSPHYTDTSKNNYLIYKCPFPISVAERKLCRPPNGLNYLKNDKHLVRGEYLILCEFWIRYDTVPSSLYNVFLMTFLASFSCSHLSFDWVDTIEWGHCYTSFVFVADFLKQLKKLIQSMSK